MKASVFLAELKAREELFRLGYGQSRCPKCIVKLGHLDEDCPACQGDGKVWVKKEHLPEAPQPTLEDMVKAWTDKFVERLRNESEELLDTALSASKKDE